MRVLVVGSSGREHALCWNMRVHGHETFCAPGNAGIAEVATCLPIGVTDFDALIVAAQQHDIDLTVVGPEGPLIAGIVNKFEAADLRIFGPNALAARAEGSKSFFKDLLIRSGIPTAPYRLFTDWCSAYNYVVEKGALNVVLKADGLARGQGVFLPETVHEAGQKLTALLTLGKVLIEDRLTCIVERSVMAIIDGTSFRMLPFTQDYKRVGEGDIGANTGGMGAHTLTLPEEEEQVLTALMARVLAAFRKTGISYRGIVYLGVMMTPEGPMVLECNCRFGDPEAQVILASIDADIATLCFSAITDSLVHVPPIRKVREALGVVMASGEYPDDSPVDAPLAGIAEARTAAAGNLVFHGTTTQKGGEYYTNRTGRIVTVVGTGTSRSTLGEARVNAYAGVECIVTPGAKCRGDIGLSYV